MRISYVYPNISKKSAHVCSEIGVKWFLFAFYDLRTALDFAFVPEFLAAASLFEPAEVCRTELKPF
jgi:hypothetical protein